MAGSRADMGLKTAIGIASKAAYTATETAFFEDNPQFRKHGILLNPGELALSVEGFIKFVEDGCKNPPKYKMGKGFRAVRSKDICDMRAGGVV